MTEENISTVDKAVMLASGALVLIAMPIVGLIVTFGGSMSPMLTWVQGESSGHALSAAGVPEGAQIVASPLIGPNLRAALLVLALTLMGILAVYKLLQVGGQPVSAPTSTTTRN